MQYIVVNVKKPWLVRRSFEQLLLLLCDSNNNIIRLNDNILISFVCIFGFYEIIIDFVTYGL